MYKLKGEKWSIRPFLPETEVNKLQSAPSSSTKNYLPSFFHPSIQHGTSYGAKIKGDGVGSSCCCSKRRQRGRWRRSGRPRPAGYWRQ